MTRTCRQCSVGFDSTDADLAFYEKVSPVFNGKKELVPPPTLCVECRRQRRLSFRNERHLYHRKCDLTGKQMIAQFADPTLKVYINTEWWSDKWDGLEYGRGVDFSRPFFEQFDELQRAVPHMNLVNDSSNENSDYANQTAYLKNSYLIFGGDYCDGCFYLQDANVNTSCVDCMNIFNCELCYECVDCSRCYQLLYSQNCENSSDGYFLKECIGCKHCFGCTGLRNKEYCMFNEQLTKEQYEAKIATFDLTKHSSREHTMGSIGEWTAAHPVRQHHNISAERSSGNFLRNVQNVRLCFDCNEIRDCTYCTQVRNGANDCMDYDAWGVNAQLLYEVVSAGYNPMNVLFSTNCWSNVHEIAYCSFCSNSSDLFGCVGLKKNQYCILNKLYTKDEYAALVPKLIEHMRTTGEWGEFFPHALSLYGYNETAASAHFPLERREVESKGWTWYEEEKKSGQYLGPEVAIPDSIDDAADDLCGQILLCASTGKPYKIIPQELKFYREMRIPIPRKCPDERHQERMQRRPPYKLWQRPCANCSKSMDTSYAPDRPEIVYCEACYLASVY